MTMFNSNQGGALYDTNGIAWTLCVGQHGYSMGYILINERTSEKNKDTASNEDRIHWVRNWGGVRLELSWQQDTQRKSAGRWKPMPNHHSGRTGIICCWMRLCSQWSELKKANYWENGMRQGRYTTDITNTENQKQETTDAPTLLQQCRKTILSCAMRTRAYAGISQRIETGRDISNSLKTVTKDFMIIEICYD